MRSSRFILPALLAAALTGGVLVTDSMARSHYSPDSGYGCEGCPGGYGQGWNRGAALSPEQQENIQRSWTSTPSVWIPSKTKFS